MTIGIYAGSFDPFTLGHASVYLGATKLFPRVVVAVGHNSQKKGTLTIEERIAAVRDTLGPTTVVGSFEGLLVEYCNKVRRETQKNVAIVRGLRALSDLETELSIADVNRRLHADIQTVFIPTEADNAYISSSVVREMALHHVDEKALYHYVSPPVARTILAKFGKPL